MSFIPWSELRDRIHKVQDNPQGLNLLYDLDHNLQNYSIDKLKALYESYKREPETDTNRLIIEKLDYLISFLSDRNLRYPFHNLISVKLILPVGCQAKCGFCYYKDKKIEKTLDREKFLTLFPLSLQECVRRARGKPLSLDITGGEPTTSVVFLGRVIEIIKEGGLDKLFKRITLTSNGYQAAQVLPIISGVVDYLNISVHNPKEEIRREIFCTDRIPDNKDLSKLIANAYVNWDVKVSSVFVVNDIDKETLDSFVGWSHSMSFVMARIRFNVFNKCHEHKSVMKMVTEATKDPNYKLVYQEYTEESSFAVLSYKGSLLVYLLGGIPNNYPTTTGTEIIVGTDGIAYLDNENKVKLTSVPHLPINYVTTRKQ